MKALILAGGTGGHVFPALAVANAMLARGWQVEWVGSDRGIENRVVPANGLVLHRLRQTGLRGKGVMARIVAGIRLLPTLFRALAIVRRYAPDVVLGMGGYASGPTGLASFLLQKPLVVHEQNAIAGTTNRLLAPFAKRILCGLPGAFRHRSVTVTGNPVRSDFNPGVANARASRPFSAEAPLHLLVLGGSLGSRPLNETVPAALACLPEQVRRTIRVTHQCGEAHLDAARAAYVAAGFESVRVHTFIDDMAVTYQSADLAICRAGALTIAELALTGTPSLLVPLPHAIDDHQTHNARFLSDAGAAKLLPQQTLTPQSLASCLANLHAHPAELALMSDNARKQSFPEATEAVLSILSEVVHEC